MKKVIVFMVSAVSISVVMYSVFSKMSSQGIFQRQQGKALLILEGQQPPYEISRLDRNMLFQAINTATYDLSYLERPSMPAQLIFEFLEPFFYPPNGFSYGDISVHVTDYLVREDKCTDAACRNKKRENNILHGSKLYFAHVSGWYENFDDTFTLTLKYPLENGSLGPEIINFSPGKNISPLLAHELDRSVENINAVKRFEEKYDAQTFRSHHFYRSEYAEYFSPSATSTSTTPGTLTTHYVHDTYGTSFYTNQMNELSISRLPKDKNYVIVNYSKSLTSIPEESNPSIKVYLTASDYKVVKVQ